MADKSSVFDTIKIAIGKAPRPIAQCLGWAAERSGLAGGHFRLWRRLGYPKRILEGPFAGMRYLPTAAGSAIGPKWIGIYEQELHPMLEQWSGFHFDLVIDVGAADGYYAVGLARKYGTKAICFDTSTYARSVHRQIARINNIQDCVEVRGECKPDDLIAAAHMAKTPIIIIDCEGYEAELLAERVVGELSHAFLIIECHDFLVDGITQTLRRRFSKSHNVTQIEIAKRDLKVIRERYRFDSSDLDHAVEEGRQENATWLAIESKSTD